MRATPTLIPRFNLDYHFKDLLLGIRAPFSKNKIDYNSLHSIFEDKPLYFINSGRSALYVILKSLNIARGSKVGVPLYSCPVVFEAIVKAGLIPEFIDIEPGTYTMDPRDLKEKIESISALIVIHTFGHPADMDKIKEIASGIPIIEDCAHSLLSKYKGNITGTIGEASFFTFRSGKPISAGEGGMLIINDENLTENVRKEIESITSHPKLSEVKHCISVYIKSLLYHRPWFGMFALPVGSLLDNSMDFMGKRGFDVTQIRKSDLSVFIKKFYNFEENVKKQRENSYFMIEQLKDTALILPQEKEWAHNNFYLFPLRFPTQIERDKASEYLRKNGVDSIKFYYDTPKIAKSNYGYIGSCLNTEIVGKTILTIPTYYTLSHKDIAKISDVVRNATNRRLL